MNLTTGRAMNSLAMATVLGALAMGLSPAWAQQPAAPDVDYSQMDHSAVHGRTSAAEERTSEAAKMGHGTPPKEAATSGAPKGAMDHGAMQGGAPPPDARDPHAYSEGYDFGAMRPMMGDEDRFGLFLVDRFESADTDENTETSYDVLAWYGSVYDRVWFKADGERDGGKLKEGRTELLWGHAIAPFWDAQLGVRHDSGETPERNWLAFGVQGLAPYWFEIEATAYVGEQGRNALRLEAEYELLLTQKLILQPRFEANVYGRRDAQRELGSGLSDAALGLRLRYEIRREFAPYIGIERSNKYGGSADFARAAGKDAGETRLVAGLRFWF